MKTKQIKSVIAALLLGTLLTSCASTYQAIGHVSMLSGGSYVNPAVKYEQLTTNTGSDPKDLKKSTAETVKAAINDVIESIPGGCFMTNVTVYAVNDGYFAVSGNVWGAAKDSIPAVRTIVINKYPASEGLTYSSTLTKGTK